MLAQYSSIYILFHRKSRANGRFTPVTVWRETVFFEITQYLSIITDTATAAVGRA